MQGVRNNVSGVGSRVVGGCLDEGDAVPDRARRLALLVPRTWSGESYRQRVSILNSLAMTFTA